MSEEIIQICKSVKEAANCLANLDSATKNKILLEVANNIKTNSKKIIKANNIDIKFAKENNLSAAKLDRLLLDENRLEALAASVASIAKLNDPVGKIIYHAKVKSNGLDIRRITVPIGVILAIYEARPNVTSDIAALALKSGNAVILRSGKESFNSSKAIAEIYSNALKKFKIDSNAIHYVNSVERSWVNSFLKMDNYIDVVIPRGGKDLVKSIAKNSRIPIFKHLDGNCHSYVESHADFDKARKIVINAKMRRVGICGACESLLIDQKIAAKFLPLIVSDLKKLGCEVRGDVESRKIANSFNETLKIATDRDFYTEYLDKIISIKIVKNIDEAITHINKYSSLHTEAIITENQKQAEKFFKLINSAIVMHNASTQFADGGEFGFGAEVGISTGKLHARGPVGLEQLVTYKYLVESDFAVRK
jgi:glutamate-5-semialdehyde dehydrogenase